MSQENQTSPDDLIAAAAAKMVAHALEVIQDNRSVAGLALPGLNMEQLIEARDIASAKIQQATGLSRMSAETYEEFFGSQAGQGPKEFPKGNFAMPIHIYAAPVVFSPIPPKEEPKAPPPDIQVLLESDWLAMREATAIVRQRRSSNPSKPSM